MEKGNYLSREQILGAAVETRDVEAFGGVVCVKELDAKTMQDLLASGAFEVDAQGKSKGTLNLGKIDLVGLAAHHIVDPDTLVPLMTRKDAQAIALKSWADVVRVATAAMQASGLDVEEGEVEVVQEQEKN